MMALKLFTLTASTMALLLVGCSTPATRIRQNPATFAKLSPTERPLVERGLLKAGMSEDAVFLAWGKPDAVRRLVRPKVVHETWIYVGTDFVPVPGYRYDWLGSRRGYARGYGYAVPVYDYMPVRTFDRSATFEGGRLIGWEAPVR